MIHLQMLGLIGNNLFQYAVARILAEDLGFELKVTHSTRLPQKNIPQLNELLAQFDDAPLSIPGKSFDDPVDRTAVMGHDGFDGYHIDLSKISADDTPRQILVEGYFERYEVFQPYKERIRKWFKLDPISLGFNISEDDVIVHIRQGDFVLLGRALSLQYYLDILEKINFRKLYICGVGIDNKIKDKFHRYNPTYIYNSPLDDFRFINGFNRIIQSQSTFVWWASFLSQAEEIYAPLPEIGAFEKLYPHINLFVDDEERYTYTNNVPYVKKKYSLRDLIKANELLTKSERTAFFKMWVKRKLGIE